MLKYDNLSKELIRQIEDDRKNHKINPYAFEDKNAQRRQSSHDKITLIRSAFIRDIDKILNCPFYSRYADKTQVFSFYKNDDISRRALHVQLVSRIARTIGKALNLNLELIEAIALGHDLGHSPFGHAGEKILDSLYFEHCARHFSHNLQSVRVLDKIFPFNMTLQTLDGIAGHNGEIEKDEYFPNSIKNFDEFDKAIEECFLDKKKLAKLSPSTLEGCVVRISDIIAYLGKDRQDGEKANFRSQAEYSQNVIGTFNAEIINNLSVNIVENSYGKNYIKLDKEYFNALSQSKKDNYKYLYLNDENSNLYENAIKPMMSMLYEKLLDDLINKKMSSPIFSHHIDYINKIYYSRSKPYIEEEPNQIVVDFIASMTDDYFISIFNHLFPTSQLKITYKDYFD